MALHAPLYLVVTAISSTRIDITWKNNDNYDWIQVYRGKGDNEAAAIADLSSYMRKPGSWEHMEDKGWEFGVEVGLEADEWYAYRIYGYTVHPAYEASAFAYNGIILLAAGYTDCVPGDIGKQVKDDGGEIGLLKAYDNALRRWFIDTALTIVSGSAMTITAGTGAGEADRQTYCTKTFMPLEKPTNVVATAISGIEIEITFKDNTLDEIRHRVERRLDAGGWALVVNLEPNREFFRDGGLFLKAAGYTDCVPGDIGQMVQDAGANLGLLVDYDNIRRRWLIDTGGDIVAADAAMTITGGTGAGDAAIATTGLIKARDYTYQVRSEDATGDSDYEPSNQETTLSEPAAPVLDLILVADTKDKSIRLRWNNVANETGYRIEGKKTANLPFGADEADLIAVVGADITDFLATGLDANTAYSFKIRAYNAAGNSAYSDTRAATTDAAYVPTEFEEWIRDPGIEPVYLAEIYTKMDLTGFVLHDDPCYRKTIEADDRGIDILEVFEDGEAYEKKDTPAQVRDNVNTFHFDYNARKLYVHATGGVNPEGSGLLIEGAFWLYFSTHKDIEFTVNGRLNHYPNYLSAEDIPDITQEIKPYYEGSFLISSGSIAFKNGGGFFDKKYVNYTWENSKLILKAGKDDFIYEDFKAILTSLIDQKSCNDSKITFSLRDIRQEMERNLILTRFNVDEEGSPGYYPDIEEDFIGEPIPLCFGTKYGVVAVPIDVGRRKYKFHDGRSKSVEAVYKNWVAGDTPLVEDTHYFVDLQRSIITFERDTFELGPEDIIDVAFIGTVNSADESIANGAEVFKYLMNQHYGLLNAELNLDSIYATKYAKTNPLSIFLYKDTPYREIVRTIEHSTEAFTFQDPEGRLGLKTQLDAAESNAKYIENYNIFNHRQSKTRKLLFWKVNIFWNENPQLQQWEVKSAQDDDIWHRYKNRNELNIYSYFSAPSAAQDLADAILTLLNKETIEDTVSMLLFDVMAGDIIKFSRDRFYNADGMVVAGSEIDLRIIRISKSPASGQTTITAEIV